MTALIVVTGCTGASSPLPASASGRPGESGLVRELAHEGEVLDGGRYTYRGMDPRIEVTVPAGWRNGHLLSQFWDVARVTDGHYSAVAFFRPSRILGEGDGAPAATPADAVALVRQNPGLQVSPPRAVELAGLSGLSVDLTAAEDDTQVLAGDQPLLGIGPSNDVRLTFLPADDGVLVVGVITPPGEMEAFTADAQAVLDSISID